MGDTRELAECALEGTQAAEINFNLIGIILESDKLYIPYLEVQSAGEKRKKRKGERSGSESPCQRRGRSW